MTISGIGPDPRKSYGARTSEVTNPTAQNTEFVVLVETWVPQIAQGRPLSIGAFCRPQDFGRRVRCRWQFTLAWRDKENSTQPFRSIPLSGSNPQHNLARTN
jgi:hypothetical protein